MCFVCTDTALDEETVLRSYTMRWQVETYFKMVKTHLKLRTECHSTSYDAITAHMVIVSIRYMILSVERFQNTDNRSLEELFYGIQREIIDEVMNSALILLLDIMLESVKDYFNATEEQINELVYRFIDKLPTVWKNKFQLSKSA